MRDFDREVACSAGSYNGSSKIAGDSNLNRAL
jgi:hypothetical protein